MLGWRWANRRTKLVRQRDATGVSAGAWTLSVLGSCLWILYYVEFRLVAALVATCAAAVTNVMIAHPGELAPSPEP
jgi:hypothetical protein